MAVSNVNHYGLLNRWQQTMHEDIWCFNQLLGSGARLVANRQNVPYVRYERDYISDALATAVMNMRDALGFYPAPTWIEEETVIVNSDLQWNRQTLETKYGYLTEFGRRAVSVIEADETVTYTDEDADGVEETATITVTSDVDVDEIQVFFRINDGADNAASEYWRIEPLSVNKSGTTVTITGHKALFAHPLRVWSVEYDNNNQNTKHSGSTTQATDFVTRVDVYRVYTDAIQSVQLIMNPDIVGSGNETTWATADVVDARMGYFTLRSASTQTWPSMQPTSAKVWYKAGYPLMNGLMDRHLELAIIRLANTMMPQQPAMFDRTLAMWETDRKASENLTPSDAWHPPIFGTTEAGMYATRVADTMQLRLKGMSVYVR